MAVVVAAGAVSEKTAPLYLRVRKDIASRIGSGEFPWDLPCHRKSSLDSTGPRALPFARLLMIWLHAGLFVVSRAKARTFPESWAIWLAKAALRRDFANP